MQQQKRIPQRTTKLGMGTAIGRSSRSADNELLTNYAYGRRIPHQTTVHPNQKRITEIEQQIAHLSWQRRQNDRLIKQGLNSTRSLKQKDGAMHLSSNNSLEHITWQNAVIDDELTRPLVLTDAEMSNVLRRERVSKERLQKYYETHHAAARKLQNLVGNRSDHASPANKGRLKELSSVEDRIQETMKDLKGEEPFINNRFSGYFGDKEVGTRGKQFGPLFDKFIH